VEQQNVPLASPFFLAMIPANIPEISARKKTKALFVFKAL
jgi:hypothetical protein